MRRLLAAGLLLALAGCGSLAAPTAKPSQAGIQIQIPPTPTPQPRPRTRGPLPAIPADDPRAMGPADAPVTVIEYSDFECPFCLQHAMNVYPQLKATNVGAGQIRYVFRNYIEVPTHRAAPAAALASLCAAAQDQFWPMHDTLFTRQQEWAADPEQAPAIFARYAGELGLDGAAFGACQNDRAMAQQVLDEINQAKELGARGTPSFFVNDVYVQGAVSYAQFTGAINQALNLK
ncbi:MAG TPA: thioredoxin domain-containing protein [Herpetosiphonaceae bacterium]